MPKPPKLARWARLRSRPYVRTAAPTPQRRTKVIRTKQTRVP